MTAIWRDHGLPSFLGIGPSFSFQDIAEIHQIAPIAYLEARTNLVRIEKRNGAEYYKRNAKLAYTFWQAKKPWYCHL